MSRTANQKKRKVLSAERLEKEMEYLKKHTPVISSTFPNLKEIRDYTKSLFPQYLVADSDPGFRFKTKDVQKIFTMYFRHYYGKYKMPKFLLNGLHYKKISTIHHNKMSGLYAAVIGSGKSLHKEFTHKCFSKKETHNFINMPDESASIVQAAMFAFAMNYTDNVGIALKISRSRIKDSYQFWLPDSLSGNGFNNTIRTTNVKNYIRICVEANAPLNEINDVWDFIVTIYGNPEFSFKGRTFSSLKLMTAQWHRDLARNKRIGGGKWEGRPIEDYIVPNTNGTMSIVQIKTGDHLVVEGNSLHHCVAGYKIPCMNGSCSIWSLRSSSASRRHNGRILTIEERAGAVRQVRGFANRLATKDEMSIVKRWAKHCNFSIANDD